MLRCLSQALVSHDLSRAVPLPSVLAYGTPCDKYLMCWHMVHYVTNHMIRVPVGKCSQTYLKHTTRTNSYALWSCVCMVCCSWLVGCGVMVALYCTAEARLLLFCLPLGSDTSQAPTSPSISPSSTCITDMSPLILCWCHKPQYLPCMSVSEQFLQSCFALRLAVLCIWICM
jgi:hypothetical protein